MAWAPRRPRPRSTITIAITLRRAPPRARTIAAITERIARRGRRPPRALAVITGGALTGPGAPPARHARAAVMRFTGAITDVPRASRMGMGVGISMGGAHGAGASGVMKPSDILTRATPRSARA